MRSEETGGEAWSGWEACSVRERERERERVLIRMTTIRIAQAMAKTLFFFSTRQSTTLVHSLIQHTLFFFLREFILAHSS